MFCYGFFLFYQDGPLTTSSALNITSSSGIHDLGGDSGLSRSPLTGGDNSSLSSTATTPVSSQLNGSQYQYQSPQPHNGHSGVRSGRQEDTGLATASMEVNMMTWRQFEKYHYHHPSPPFSSSSLSCLPDLCCSSSSGSIRRQHRGHRLMTGQRGYRGGDQAPLSKVYTHQQSPSNTIQSFILALKKNLVKSTDFARHHISSP